MTTWIGSLDDLLRGNRTGARLLDDHAAAIPLRAFALLAVVLGLCYGFFMGWYGAFSRPQAEYPQLFASMVKVPALFLLTLLVTFPSLYVFAALAGCRLSFTAVLRLLVAAIVVNLAVAASLGPILGFFTVSTTSYPFMILLNVVVLGLAGFVGLGFLLSSLRKLAASTAREMAPAPMPLPASPAPVAGEGDEDAQLRALRAARQVYPTVPPANPEAAAYRIFYVWVVIYGLVGAQMGWLLRPFIGHPGMPFTWFRERQGNFFLAVFSQIDALMK